MSQREVGARLRSARLAKGISQRELAEPRYTRPFVTAIEAGKRAPSDDAVAYFAEKLGLDPTELATGRPKGLDAQLDLLAVEARRALSRGDHTEAWRIIDELEAAVGQYSAVAWAGKVEELRGLSHERRGELEQAIERYERACELFAEHGMHRQANAVAGKSRCLHTMGDTHHAIFVLDSLIDRMNREGVPDPTALVRLHASLILPCLDLGAQQRAADAAEAALALRSQTDDPATLATLHVNVAWVYIERGAFDAAATSIHEAQRLLDEADLRGELGMAHVARAIVARHKLDYETARTSLTEAIRLLEESRNPIEAANARIELAKLTRDLGDPSGAKQLLDRVIEEFEGLDVHDFLAEALRERAAIRLAEEPVEAEKDARRALELHRRAHEGLAAAMCHLFVGDALRMQGREGAASEAFRDGLLEIAPLLRST